MTLSAAKITQQEFSNFVLEQPLEFTFIYSFSVCLIGAGLVCERKTTEFFKTVQQGFLNKSTFGEEKTCEGSYILN
jgi:hypothetical protein